MSRPDASAKPHIVIVGGGFGGLAAAKALARAPVRVTVIDRRNHHVFQPLLYQVASAVLSPGDIAEPIRGILRKARNVEVMLAEVTAVDLANDQLHIRRGDDGASTETLGYDHLVMAAGARDHYFGNDGWSAHAPGLKSVDDALEIRKRVLLAFERAEWCTDPAERKRLLTFIVVGGGPTGVELAGALSEIARQTLLDDFRHIDPEDAEVILVEGGDKVLGSFGDPLPQRALDSLERVGVQVRLGERVEHIDEDGAVVGGDRIEAATVLWAAGVRAATVSDTFGTDQDRTGRVVVNADLTVPGHDNVYVIGDQAHFAHGTDKPLPGVAQVALQGGKCAAMNIQRRLNGRDTQPFVYRDLGSMATVGRKLAVAEIGKLRFGGVIAWIAWLFVHLLALIGFRNRLVVMTQWAWSYFTYERNSRLIR